MAFIILPKHGFKQTEVMIWTKSEKIKQVTNNGRKGYVNKWGSFDPFENMLLFLFIVWRFSPVQTSKI